MPKLRANRPGLDRAAVVKAAAELLNVEGSEALTINRLAGVLGVQPPSLYNHIGGLPELWHDLELLNTHALGECLAEAAVGRSGPDGISALAYAYRNYVKQNPGLYQSVLHAPGSVGPPDPELTAAAERVVRTVTAVVSSLGLTGDDAIHAVRALRSAVHGFASLEVAGGFGLPLDTDESFRRLVRMVIRGLTTSLPVDQT